MHLDIEKRMRRKLKKKNYNKGWELSLCNNLWMQLFVHISSFSLLCIFIPNRSVEEENDMERKKIEIAKEFKLKLFTHVQAPTDFNLFSSQKKVAFLIYVWQPIFYCAWHQTYWQNTYTQYNLGSLAISISIIDFFFFSFRSFFNIDAVTKEKKEIEK